MCACARGRSRKLQTSSVNASFAEPEKILNLSSRRPRCGLRALLGCTFAFSVAVLIVVAIVDTQYSVVLSLQVSRFWGLYCPATQRRLQQKLVLSTRYSESRQTLASQKSRYD